LQVMCPSAYCFIVYWFPLSFITCFGLHGHLQVCMILHIFKDSVLLLFSLPFLYVVTLCMFLICVLFLCCFPSCVLVFSCLCVCLFDASNKAARSQKPSFSYM
jgi:hypothetical protein